MEAGKVVHSIQQLRLTGSWDPPEGKVVVAVRAEIPSGPGAEQAQPLGVITLCHSFHLFYQVIHPAPSSAFVLFYLSTEQCPQQYKKSIHRIKQKSC